MSWSRRNPQDAHSPMTMDEMKTIARQFRSDPRRLEVFRGPGSAKKCYKAAKHGGTDDVSVRLGKNHYAHYRLVPRPVAESALFLSRKSARARRRVRAAR